MQRDFSYIISPLSLEVHSEWGPSIRFIDHEHFDYIDDVLTELFDVEYTFRIEDDMSDACTIYFESSISLERLRKVVDKINQHHVKSGREYELSV